MNIFLCVFLHRAPLEVIFLCPTASCNLAWGITTLFQQKDTTTGDGTTCVWRRRRGTAFKSQLTNIQIVFFPLSCQDLRNLKLGSFLAEDYCALLYSLKRVALGDWLVLQSWRLSSVGQ